MCLQQALINNLNYTTAKCQTLRNQEFRALKAGRKAAMTDNTTLDLTPQPSRLDDTTANKHDSDARTVKDRLSPARASTRKSYVHLLALLLQRKELTISQAAEIFGEKHQNQHGRFSRMAKFGLLQREMKHGPSGKREYYYSLSPDIPADEIKALAEEYDISLDGAILSKTIKEPTMSSQHITIDTDRKTESSTTDLLVSKLPEFDPTWPQEVKESWFKSYQQLIEMAKK